MEPLTQAYIETLEVEAAGARRGELETITLDDLEAECDLDAPEP